MLTDFQEGNAWGWILSAESTVVHTEKIVWSPNQEPQVFDQAPVTKISPEGDLHPHPYVVVVEWGDYIPNWVFGLKSSYCLLVS